MALFILISMTVLPLARVMGAFGPGVDGVVYVFGDSYADTGNHDPESEQVSIYQPWRPPYGNWWPGLASGRYSNGHVFTDFFASYMGMQQPVPFRMFNVSTTGHEDASLEEARALTRSRGINFAFGGSGVFTTSNAYVINVSTQIEQLRTTIDMGIVTLDDRPESLALFVINGNDYMNYIQLYPDLTGIDDFIVEVVDEMESDLETLSDLGFTKFVIPNLGPLGCVPYLTSSVNYTYCLDIPNNLSALHNALLDARVSSLQDKLPNATFHVLDLNNAMTKVVEDGVLSLTPCCKGITSSYNCGNTDEIGELMYTLCTNEGTSLYWDEVHPTDHGWTKIFKNIVLPSLKDTSEIQLVHAKS